LKDRIRAGVGFEFNNCSELTSGEPSLLEYLQQNYSSDLKAYIRAGQALAKTISTFPSIDEALHWWSASQCPVAG
jgi:hypothetical protein